jgi:hypothetical protein
MVLLPHVGYRRELVRIIFEDHWIEPREFTVNVMAKEKRDFKRGSSYFLRSLQEVTEDIINTLVAVMDYAKTVAGIEVSNDDYHLFFPLFSRVLDEINDVKDEKKLDRSHRLH